MTTRTLHARPALGSVAREQLRAVGLAIRTETLLAVLFLLGGSVLTLATDLGLVGEARDRVSLDVTPDLALPVILLGFFLPLAVWKSEEPERRTYLWAMPVERGHHQLIKSGAGWIWLMLALAAYLLWMGGLGSILGSATSAYEVHFFIGENPMRDGDPQDWWTLTIPVPAWQWLVPFSAVTIAYLLGSAMVLATNHPWRWGAGIWLAFMVFASLVDATEWQGGRELMQNVLGNRSAYGLETALTGMMVETMEYTRRSGEVATRNLDRPQLGAWLTATALWLGLAATGAWLAATRHREP